MEREVANKLFKLYKLEKECDRGIYPEELHTHGICTRSQVKPLIEKLVNASCLIEENVRGANAYRISKRGIINLESYLDLKREM